MTNEQLAILIGRYAAMLNAAMAKIDSCGANEEGYRELNRLYMVLRDDYELLDGTTHNRRNMKAMSVTRTRK